MAASMKHLALALLLCAMVSLSNSCYRIALKPGTTHCQDGTDKTWHAVGSKWRNSRCEDCTCSGCCAGYPTPVEFPDDCVPVFDPEVCEYIVHRKGDPSVLCPVFGSTL